MSISKKNIAAKNLQNHLNVKIQKILHSSFENPMVKASHVWAITSDQLEAIIGPEIFKQWFSDIRPIVVADKVLLLQARNTFAAHWLTTHYQKLVDLLLKAQDKELSCFFISPKDRGLNEA